MVNFGPHPVEIPTHEEVLLASGAMPAPTMLGTDTAVWFR
ncbi:MAG: hypothetical protein GY724_02860 [Actinomycetia bacterium]|nr:hypothetical protein [Actinomycetes bacterium]